MKDKQPLYCKDSSELTNDQLQEYHRLEFLKIVERDLQYMELEGSHRNIQLVKL